MVWIGGLNRVKDLVIDVSRFDWLTWIDLVFEVTKIH